MPEPRPTARQRRAVARRARERCEYCLSPAAYCPDSLAVEHIFPQSRGGTNSLSNLAFSCQGCNNRKYTSFEATDPSTGEPVPLYHPRQDLWSDHFAWEEDSAQVLGLTPTGRATVDKLQLNRSEVVNLRRLLLLIGEHPPAASDPEPD